MQISFLFCVCLLFTYIHEFDNKTWNTVQCRGCVASRTGLAVHPRVPQGHTGWGSKTVFSAGFHTEQTCSCSPAKRAKSSSEAPCSLWRGRHSSEVPWAGVPVVVQLLFDVHHVPGGLLVLPVVTFPELLQVTKFGNPRPGIVWKAERREVRDDGNGKALFPSQASRLGCSPERDHIHTSDIESQTS